MLRWLRSALPRRVTLVLYALAVLALGFAHRPLDTAGAEDLAAYALPDGSIPVICGSKGDGRPSAQKPVCEACCLTSAPGLLERSFDLAPPAFEMHDLAWSLRRENLAASLPRHAFQARGPPSV